MDKVTKLKVLDGRTTVEGVAMNRQTPEAVILKDCPDIPSKSFREALSGVRNDVVKVFGFPKSVADRLVLTGVDVNEDGNGHRSFVFTCKLQCGAGTVAVNSPLMREKVEKENGKTVLSDVALKRVDKLLAEALNYRNGGREQFDLGLEDAETEPATAAK